MVTIKAKAGTPMTMDETDRPTFKEWFARVDALLSRHIGLGADDLPDCPWMDWYENRLRPIRAANKALKRAGADYF